MQPLEGETFQDGEGYLITSIKYNGAVCTSVYQSLSDIQENKMQYIELDAKLKKNTSYQLCFEVLNTQRKIRAWGINASLEEPELGVQFLFLSPLSWVAYVLSLIHISEPTRRVVISYAVFCLKKIFLMIRRPPRSTLMRSSAASDVYKRQVFMLMCSR